MRKIEIKNRFTGEIILCGEYESVKDCLQKNKGANLRGADLTGADLTDAYLSVANLSWANLSGANLSGANLSGANLSRANLSGANLSGANLSWANLSWAKNICPPIMLLANWRDIPDYLCLELMRYDAANHPRPEMFIVWAKGGSCPYSNTNYVRSANFAEKRELIKHDFLSLPVKSAYELMQMLIKEKCK